MTKFIDWASYKIELKNDVSRLIYKYTRRNPIIIPVLISTDVDSIKSKRNEKNVQQVA